MRFDSTITVDIFHNIAWVVGLAERLVQQLIHILRTLAASQTNIIVEWDQYMPMAMQAINSRKLQSHGFSPAQVLFGFQPTYFGTPELQKDIIANDIITHQFESGPVNLETQVDVAQERLAFTREMVQQQFLITIFPVRESSKLFI
ncbi:uncharacterized protein N7503_004781 [Penicillium pulvis]|uniref:uncharacterized protein n=1 Tax=Penicillium pulvis TaxID=1562058 RepID=UPI0025476D9A|nr:uncharacterized protein N7503_004781 [Penicillium pulvis]KAJ5802331.1 hypothetical protein N7503_004781 [Penicillium pulvis]